MSFVWPVTWQLGLVERELNEVLQGVVRYAEAREREERDRLHQQVQQHVLHAMEITLIIFISMVSL
jgi:hypothetical protein